MEKVIAWIQKNIKEESEKELHCSMFKHVWCDLINI